MRFYLQPEHDDPIRRFIYLFIFLYFPTRNFLRFSDIISGRVITMRTSIEKNPSVHTYNISLNCVRWIML